MLGIEQEFFIIKSDYPDAFVEVYCQEQVNTQVMRVIMCLADVIEKAMDNLLIPDLISPVLMPKLLLANQFAQPELTTDQALSSKTF